MPKGLARQMAHMVQEESKHDSRIENSLKEGSEIDDNYKDEFKNNYSPPQEREFEDKLV